MTEIEVKKGANAFIRGEVYFCINAKDLDDAVAEYEKRHPGKQPKSVIEFGNHFYFSEAPDDQS